MIDLATGLLRWVSASINVMRFGFHFSQKPSPSSCASASQQSLAHALDFSTSNHSRVSHCLGLSLFSSSCSALKNINIIEKHSKSVIAICLPASVIKLQTLLDWPKVAGSQLL